MDVFYLLSVFPVSLFIIFIALYIDSTPNTNTKSKINTPLDKEKETTKPYEWNVNSFFED